MQSKGTLGSLVAGIIAIFLVAICLFYLSFTLVSRHHETKAEVYAVEIAGTGNENSDSFNQAKKHYIDSISQEKVWLGYTFNEVQRWGVGLGLDLKGGMSVILQVSMPDMLRSLATTDNKDEDFNRAIAVADSVTSIPGSNADYIKTFIDTYRQARPNKDFSTLFEGKVKKGATNEEVISALKGYVKDIVDNSATNVLRKRIDAYGVVSPNIQVLQGKDGQILLELPGVKEPERVAELLQRSANLEFFVTYRDLFGAEVLTPVNNLENQLQAEGQTLTGLAYTLVPATDERGNFTGKYVDAQKGFSP
ncbi:MAG: hypothetical protein K2G64_01120, partial [Muribaculaceae bacterium]|nr:hypothetical protein [Muribaculaceae bacterium]